LAVGSALRLELELPGRGGELSINCRVVYVRDVATAERTGKPAGMGIQFLDLREADLARIGRFIADHGVGSVDSSRPLRAKPLKVLVVDDDHVAREEAARPFRDRGDEVESASDGVAALAACLREPPDVIVSDVQMPRMDGWQLVRIVRSRPELAEVPLLFLTSVRGEEDRIKGYQLGVDDFVAKPSRAEELLARVDRVVSRVKRPPSESQTMLRGDIEHVPLASVLSLLELEKKTGILRVMSSGVARLHIANGRMVRADIEGDSGGRPSRAVLDEVLDWTTGQFEFTACEVTCEDEIRKSLTSLLLDHACANDEAGRDDIELSEPRSEEKRTAYEEPINPDELDWDPSTP
jgi:CheY-like chemotaxis protein